jgi:UDP-N-acetylmuramoyl-tripeptide--D-alanyl-D-alanine ligase
MKGALVYGDLAKVGRVEAVDAGERYLIEAPHVVIDSREAVAGSVFVALPGERTDGHRYVSDVFVRGAAWAVVERGWYEVHRHGFTAPEHRFVVVEDPVAALQGLASGYRGRFDIPVIGVGGSNGKTTTKEMVAAVLAGRYRVHMSQGNRNNHLGVPLTLLQMRRETGIAVVEMGINHPGEMEFLCGIARPTHGLLTNIGHEHLEFFGSLDGVAEAEAALFRYLEASGGTVFLNLDDFRLAAAGAELSRKVAYGASCAGGAAWWAEDISADRVGRVSFTLCSSACRQPIPMQFIGRHNVINAVAAATVGDHFGLGPDEIAAGLSALQPAKGWKRMELLEGGGIVVLNDTYNANPDSVRFALDTLASIECSGRKIAVIGDMLELGDTSEVEHEAIGRYIQQVPIDALATYGPMSRIVCHEAGSTLCSGHFDTMEALSEFLAGAVQSGDALLFKGSRGMRLEVAAEALLKAKSQE